MFVSFTQGNFVNLGISLKNVKVKIGKGFCNVTSLGTQLTCKPPKTQPKSLQGSHYPEVEVSKGQKSDVNLNAWEHFEILHCLEGDIAYIYP